jgi:hypothetical protein
MGGYSLGLSRFARGRTGGTGVGAASADATGKIYTVSGLKPGSTAILYANGTQAATTTADSSGLATWTLGAAPAAGTIMTYDGTVTGSAGTAVAPVVSIAGTPSAASVGVAYNFTPTVSGGSGTKSFSRSGALPPGLSFSSPTGAITGTPTTGGTFSGIGITVADSTGSAMLSGLSITVSTVPVPTEVPRAPSVSAVGGNVQAILRMTDDPASVGVQKYGVYASATETGTYTRIAWCYNARDFRRYLSNGSTEWYKVSSWNALGEGPQSAAVSATAAAANNNPLRLIGVVLFAGVLFYEPIAGDFKSGSTVAVTASDGTTLQTKTQGGAVIVYGTFATTGSKTLTFTETLSAGNGGGTSVSSQTINVVAKPVAVLADLKATANRLKARINAKPTYTPTTLTLTDNGNTKPSGYTYSTTYFDGRSAPAGQAYASVGGFQPPQFGASVYDFIERKSATQQFVPLSAATNNGVLRMRLFKQTWVLPISATPGVPVHVKIRYSDDEMANLKEHVEPFFSMTGNRYLKIDPGVAAPGAGRIWEVEFSSYSILNNPSFQPGFGYESGETPQAVNDSSPVAVGMVDSFMNGVGALDQTQNMLRVAARQLGLLNVWNMGIPAHRYTLPATSVFPLGLDRIGANVLGIGDVTSPQAADVIWLNPTINDNGQSDQTQMQAMMTNLFLKARYLRPGALIIFTLGFWAPQDPPSSAVVSTYRAAITAANDPGLYLHDGVAQGWATLTAGGTGASPNFYATNAPTATGSVAGNVMTVTSGSGIEPGHFLFNAAGNTFLLSRVYKQLTGTTGGAGTYQLDLPPNGGDIAAGTTLNFQSENGVASYPVHPKPGGHVTYGGRMADAVVAAVDQLIAA